MSISSQYTSTATAFRLTDTPATGSALPATDPSALGVRPLAVYLQADTQNIRFTTDGTAPTSSEGTLLVAGAAPFYYGAGPLGDLQFIQTESGSKLNVFYSQNPLAQGAQGGAGAQGVAGAAGVQGPQGIMSAADLAALGVPVVLGPFTLDFTDILHNTNRHTLFTPDVGDLILNWWTDPNTYIGSDGDAVMGQGTGWTVTAPGDTNRGPLGQAWHGGDSIAADCTMMAQSGSYQNKVNAAGVQVYTTLWPVTTAGPVQVENSCGVDLESGHADYYFLVKKVAT